MTDSYADVGYGDANSRIAFGERAAILVVDFQVAFTDARFPLGGQDMIQRATDRTAELLRVARPLGVPVASCYTAYDSPADMPHWKVKPVQEEFFHGHPCTAMDERIHDPDHDFVFCKNAPSIFFLTPLTTFLHRQRVDTVIITGCTTSGCVRASVNDAFSHGYRVFVPEDCVGDVDEGPHQANLRDVGRRYCEVTTAAAMEEQLRSMAH